MHVIIPMSGRGNRFVEAGYKDPKPLIKVDGKPIIEHVCDLFPGEDKFTFICANDHLQTTDMREVLLKLKPKANIIGIDSHKKGPVYATSLIYDLIDDEEEVIVNYCDFGTYWDYKDFLKHTRNRKADGAVPSYKGFHPHMLGSDNYAFIKSEQQWLQAIKEKEPFTDNRTSEFASNGTYYFRTGAIVKKYFNRLMERDINLKGEYYISLVYNLLVEDGLKVSVYEIQHMLQWGTPKDLQEYEQWSNCFRNMISTKLSINPRKNYVNLIPMAGGGSRFVKEGYKLPKPLIEVSGKPMVVQAVNHLPAAEENVFVCQKQHLTNEIENVLNSVGKRTKITTVDGLTEGQAITCLSGLSVIDNNVELLVSACDNGMIFDEKHFQELLDTENVDAIVFGFTHHIGAKINQQMYGWIKHNNFNVTGVSVKVAISNDPYNDYGIIGAFYFRKAKYLKDAINALVAKNIRVNNEFYVDSCINELVEAGLKVKLMPVKHYICWGTPNDLKTFQYWQSFFHKSSFHPYRLEDDPFMAQEKAKEYDAQFKSFKQEYE